MGIYSLGLWIMGIGSLFSRLILKNQKTIIYYIGAFVTISILALRQYSVVGVDLLKYYRTYTMTSSMSLEELVGIRDGSSLFYYLLCAIASKIGIPYQLFVSLVGVFCGIVTWWFIYKYVKVPELGFLFYIGMGVYTFQFSGLKQSIAMALLLICFDRFYRKQIARCAFFLLLATMFHPTAVVFVIFLCVSKIRVNKWIILLYTAVFAAMFVMRMQIASTITLLFSDEYVGKYQSSGSIGGMSIFLIILLGLYLFTQGSKILIKDSLESQMTIMLMLAVVIQIFSSYAYSFTRLNLYFFQFMGIVASDIIISKRWALLAKRFHPIARAVVFAIISYVLILQFGKQLELEVLTDYQFFWEI